MKPISKKNKYFFLIIILFIGLFFINIQEAKAVAWFVPVLIAAIATGGAIALFPEILTGAVGQVVHLIGLAAEWFLGIMSNLFNVILQITTEMLSQPVVYEGWTITRDIVNMFFILGLVVIAFATILRIETYGMKALLPKIIIMALLINFSFLACGIIIDAANVPTEFFINKITENDKAKIGVGGFMQATLIKPKKNSGMPVLPEPSHQLLNELVQALVHGTAALVILIGAILLIVRMGALWVLIILVPFAWFFSIFPALKGMSKKWWDNFLKYAFFAPIFVFFIYLSVRVINILTPAYAMSGMSEAFSSSIVTFAQFVVAVVLLCGAPIVAMSMGIYGSRAVTSAVKGAAKSAVKIPTRAAIRKAGTWMAKKGLPTPKVLKQAWAERREEKERKAYAPAIGAWQDRFNRFFGKEKTFHQQRARDLLVDSKRADLRKQNLGKDALADIANASKKSKDMPNFQAAALELASRGEEDTLLKHEQLGAKYNREVNPVNMQNLIKDSVPDKNEAARFAGKLSAAAAGAGNPQYAGIIKYDDKAKKMTWGSAEEMSKKGAESAMKMSSEQRWRTLKSGAFFNMDNKGNPSEVSGAFKNILGQIGTNDIESAVKEMPNANKRLFKEQETKIRKQINKIKIRNPAQAGITKEWLDKIVESVGGGGGGEMPPEVTTA